MRTTLTLTVDEDLAEFVRNQQGIVDPSAFISMLLREDMERRGIRIDSPARSQSQDAISRELELLMDEDAPAAG